MLQPFSSVDGGAELRKRGRSQYAGDKFGPHVMSGVDKTRAAGNLGSGVEVRSSGEILML